MIRVFVLFMLGLAVGLTAIVTYWVLEALLASYSDYKRGMWEGAAVVMAMHGGRVVINAALQSLDARPKKKERAA